jgi:hypothetical protein
MITIRCALLGGVDLHDTGTTTLNGGITNSDTTITVPSTSSFKTSAPGTIVIDTERIDYSATTPTTFTGCTRGVYGTTAASHSNGATVNEIEMVSATDLNDTFSAMTTQATTSYLAGLPLGAILPFHASMSGAGTLPDFYIECNGQTITDGDSPFYGLNAPSLNGTTDADKRFLRGNSASGTTGGSETHYHDPPILYSKAGSGSYQPRSITGATSIPPYFEVRWVMRIK